MSNSADKNQKASQSAKGGNEQDKNYNATQKQAQQQQAKQGQGQKNQDTPKLEAPGMPEIKMPDAPGIELPKGGGALQGIGEKFTANPATGTASFSVPIAMSPGRSGFGPQLGLSYDSGAGNSPFGLGWNVGVASIMRKTQRELPQYMDAKESDTFILSGAEDLVPLLKEDSGNWVSEDYTSGSYEVKRYRPRTEGLWARIERWHDTTTGISHWKTISKSNMTTIYGESASCRIADPTDSTKVFKWLIEKSYDEKGNVLVYEYKRENTDGLNGTEVHETNRLKNNSAFNQLYLKRVYYSNTVMYNDVNFGTTNEWLFQLVFDYGEHPGTTPALAESQDWNLRNDAFSSYRSGFEIRTYRRCERILQFHNFTELDTVPVLVKETKINYNALAQGNQVSSVQHIAHEPGETPAAMPAVEFQYTEATRDEKLRTFNLDDLENLPGGIDGQNYTWADLDGEGISGVLIEQARGWYYKRNLGDRAYYEDFSVANPPEADIKLGALEHVAERPNLGAVQQFGDLNGDGLAELFVQDQSFSGYFEMNEEGEWKRFKTIDNYPNINPKNPNLKRIDPNGDGIADLFISEDNCFRYYPSEEELQDGYGYAREIAKPSEEAEGPAIIFADASQTIYTADMSGDGLTDIVRVRNGEVCYWPNMGHGRFGAKVTMDASPHFDHPDQFEQGRVKLADVDGTGTTDIVYLGAEKVHYWQNQSGNRFALEDEIVNFPKTDRLTSVSVMDIFGKGTSCMVWSSPLPGDDGFQVRYLDLMGQKPYLLKEINNNMGMVQRMHYVPSTKFYQRDRNEGRPWITKLPFPVQVLERSEVFDEITQARFVSRYAYHHGYFDRHEKEFRGFGMVEQWDTEQYEAFGTEGLFQVGSNLLDESSHTPPVYAKTWFHNGYYEAGGKISQQYASEYFSGDANAWELPDSTLPSGLTAAETREALRALRGQALRSEVYAEDGSADSNKPYAVTGTNYHIKMVQPKEGNKHAVFFSTGNETLSYQYERDVDDPRIAHQMVLETDNYGLVTKAAAVAYPRRGSGHEPEQLVTSITYSEADYIHEDDNANFYRIGIPYQSKGYEITGISASTSKFVPSTIASQIASATAIDYEDAPTSGVEKRLLAWQKMYFYNEALNASMPLGSVASHAMPYQALTLALTPGLLTEAYNNDGTTRVTESMLLTEGKYVKEDNLYWVPSGIMTFDDSNFFVLTQSTDPFGNSTGFSYDSYYLFATSITDALSNSISMDMDYRVLAPWQTTDINENRQQVAFDVRGMVTKMAVMGKVSESLGDTLSDPTVKLTYDLFNWQNNQEPNYAKVEARIEHGNPSTNWQTSYEYTGGLGKVLLVKVQAEPGDAFTHDGNGDLEVDEDGLPVKSYTSTRWVGNGRTIINNKGLPIKQYEPYFSDTSDFEDEDEVRQYGVSPLLQYDSMGRNVRTDMPDGTFTKVEFTPWWSKHYDAVDTVLDNEWYAKRRPGQLKYLLEMAPEFIATGNKTILKDEIGEERDLRPLSCYYFDGASEAQFSNGVPSVSGPDAAAYSLWFKTSASGVDMHFLDGDSNGANYMLGLNSGGNLMVRSADSAYAYSTGTFNDGEWHLLVANFDFVAETTTYYIDGQEILNQAWGSGNKANLSLYTVGSEGATGYYTGYLKDIRLHNCKLDDTQRTALESFNALDTEVAWLKCEEETGAIAINACGTGLDATITATVIGDFHHNDAPIGFSFANAEGFTIADGNSEYAINGTTLIDVDVVIPRQREDDLVAAVDSNGEDLEAEHLGRAAYAAYMVESDCVDINRTQDSYFTLDSPIYIEEGKTYRFKVPWLGYATPAGGRNPIFGNTSGSDYYIGLFNNFIAYAFGGSSSGIPTGADLATNDNFIYEAEISNIDNTAGTLDLEFWIFDIDTGTQLTNKTATGVSASGFINAPGGTTNASIEMLFNSDLLTDLRIPSGKFYDYEIYVNDTLTHKWVFMSGADKQYDIVGGNHLTLVSSDPSATYAQTQDHYNHKALYGFTRYTEDAGNGIIDVPFDLNGDPLSITTPSGYTKEADYSAGTWLQTADGSQLNYGIGLTTRSRSELDGKTIGQILGSQDGFTLLNGKMKEVMLDMGPQGNAEPKDPEERAAWLAEKHYNTPQVQELDNIGRPFRTRSHNGFDENGDPVYYDVRVELNIQGMPVGTTDPKSRTLSNLVPSPIGPLRTHHIDNGTRRSLINVAGNPLYAWDDRSHKMRMAYDELQRNTHQYLTEGAGSEELIGFTAYGDNIGITNPENNNLKGQAVRSFDQSGVSRLTGVDFKGNPLSTEKVYASDYINRIDWSAIGGLTSLSTIDSTAASQLESETFTSTITYDALNRPLLMTLPDTTEVEPGYNEAGFLESVKAKIRGAASYTDFVTDINYDEKGQRTKIVYGNGAQTKYTYDTNTYRLNRLLTTRNSGVDILQDIHYTYDPVGNIVEIQDDAQQTIYFDNAVVHPNAKYHYDAVYRLIKATGREHAYSGQVGYQDASSFTPVPRNNSNELRRYIEQFEYDEVGNIMKMIHRAKNGNWTRGYAYSSTNNYLEKTSLPGDTLSNPATYSQSYTYDAHGNLQNLPHLSGITWDFLDQIKEIDLGGGGTAYYVYSSGQRVRKVIVNGTLTKDRLYLGSNEIYREKISGSLNLERETLHISDDKKRIAIVDTKTYDGDVVSSPPSNIRYQLGNHLQSASLELDDTAAVITYEEYHPFGTSSYRLGSNSTEVALKRYRYVGKEHDDESGMYYYGARYYAAWLGRFVSVDPLKDDYPMWSSFVYAGNRPIVFTDVNGMGPDDPEEDPSMATYTFKSGDNGLWTAAKNSYAEYGAGMTFEEYWTAFKEWNDYESNPNKIYKEGDQVWVSAPQSEDEQWGEIAQALQAFREEKAADSLSEIDKTLDEMGINSEDLLKIIKDVYDTMPYILKSADLESILDNHNVSFTFGVYSMKKSIGSIGSLLKIDSGVGTLSADPGSLKFTFDLKGNIDLYTTVGASGSLFRIKAIGASYNIGVKSNILNFADGIGLDDFTAYEKYSGDALGWNLSRTTTFGKGGTVEYDLKIKVSVDAGFMTVSYTMEEFESPLVPNKDPESNSFISDGVRGYRSANYQLQTGVSKNYMASRNILFEKTNIIQR
ncbi:hypothetical protein GC194_14960 [bacterium]|nr:hypothetical protein [bacterium]